MPRVPLLAIYIKQGVSGQFAHSWKITMPNALVVDIVLIDLLLIYVVFVPFILILT